MDGGDSRPPRLLSVAAGVIVVAALHFARGLFLPLALAALLSLLLLPMVRFVQRLGGGRLFSILGVVLTFSLVLGAITWVTVRQGARLVRQLPEYRVRVLAKAEALGPVGRALTDAQKALEELGGEMAAPEREKPLPVTRVEVVPPPARFFDLVGPALIPVFQSLGTTFFVLILIIFFLVYHVDLRDRLVHLVGDTRVNLTTQTMTEAVASVSRYLFLLSVVNVVFGALVTLGLVALGLPNALLWGMLAALLRFVPYVGTWVAALMPLLLSVAVFDRWGPAVAILSGWIVVEFVIANVVEPWIYGAHTGLSPLAVILAAFFWTWIWGGTGLLLAIPLTVSLVVVGKNIPRFEFLQTLLGSEAALEPKVQLYHRLLARDQHETEALVDQFQAGRPPQEVYDRLILPALSLAESDRYRGLLEEEREAAIVGQLKDIVEDLGERFEEEGRLPATAAGTPSAVRIVGLPAGNPADSVALQMLTRLIAGKGWRVEAASEQTTAGQKVDLVGSSGDAVVVLSSVSPSSLMQVRYLYKRIRRERPKVPIVLGLWAVEREPVGLKSRTASDENIRIVRSLGEAADQIRQFAQSIVPGRTRPPTELHAASR
ncbi:MAG TPA: AI-2E family transporter [Planctomycetota bacterium]|jgi:predicted PurR-regulated permease PerM|nr:AI-2E family transporter [Planctomycetota bacterium]